MKNYFETQKINWKTWSPESIFFKSNQLTKKLLPQENVVSWTSKNNRDHKMCQLTGGKALQGHQGHSHYGNENYKGVMVQLKDLKSDFPSANIDFIDRTHRKDSVGNNVGGLDVLVYLNSFHSPWEYAQCSQTGNWVRKTKPNVAPLAEGYRMCYGGQGDSNSMLFDEFQELIQIVEGVKNFLIEVIVPDLQGLFLEEDVEEGLLIA
jgi:hypothetical protein